MDIEALLAGLQAGELPAWALPAVALLAPVFSAEILTHVYKMGVKESTGRKPARWRTLAFSMGVCAGLGVLSWWLYSESLRMAVLVGITIGPASPVLWVLVLKPIVARIAKSEEGRGERRQRDARPPADFECRRAPPDEEVTRIGAVTRWLSE